jgi:anion-transporting  ArsA/GET3 family ATPase
MAAAAALLLADLGRRVLLVEVDAKGDVPAQFEQKAVGFTPREVYPGVLAMAMDTEASLREYLKVNMRVPVIGRLGPLAHVLDFVAEAAPGVKEILTVGKIMWEVRESIEGRANFDVVVVDAAASGHIVAQLGAADAIQELVDVGPLSDQTRWVADLIADPHVTAVNIVTTPEEMPVTETIELVARVRAEVEVPLGVVIVNRVLPELFTHSDEETFEALRTPAAAQVLTERAGGGALAVLDAARLAVSLRRTRAAHLEELKHAVELPLLYVPYLFVRDHGLRVTRMVADALGAELGH